MEQFMTKFPEHVNLKMDYSHTPLHMAALMNSCDTVKLLADQVRPFNKNN